MIESIPMTTPRTLAAIATAACIAGCAAQPEAALDIELVPDLSINTANQVAERVVSLELIVDRAGGLYADCPSALPGVINADADPECELVTQVSMPGRLPLVRLLRGGLSDEPIDLWLRGLGDDAGATVAEGRVLGVGFTSGIRRLPVTFNLRPSHLPLRVVEVFPGDGDIVRNCDLNPVVIMFSKPIDPQTIFAPGAVRFDPGGPPVEIRVAESGLLAQLAPPPIDPRPSPDGIGPETLIFTLELATTVLDTLGDPLDQVPMEPGAQPYRVISEVRCTSMSQIPDDRCGADPEGASAPRCPAGRDFVCVDRICVPQSCDSARCALGSVCDPATLACEVDCRAYGEASICGAERPICAPDSGVCVAPSP